MIPWPRSPGSWGWLSPRSAARSLPAGAAYDPQARHAQARAARARPKARVLDSNDQLRALVVQGLRQRWSPQQISRRLAADHPERDDLRVSHETIYQSLYVQGRGTLRAELGRHYRLRTGRSRRVPRSALAGPLASRPWLADARISTRPAQVADRAVPGHWEGDLVMGAGNRTAMITLVERTTRLVLIAPLLTDHTATTVATVLETMIKGLPRSMARSLTWDQGGEMAQVARFRTATNLEVYFCDPHSPWQRGTNENTNGLIREFFPKGTDLSTYPLHAFEQAQHLLNTRPRQTLDWATPAEAFNRLLQKTEHDTTIALTT
ncbi:IS30 family transposase [Actinomyces howellii]|uniref:IS30 family transposase n=1 Tax=Actinomyces howellii TaxID=52771 RepID=UPI0013E0A9A5|nr:IS30 family transposase [Actinomyces howellii]